MFNRLIRIPLLLGALLSCILATQTLAKETPAIVIDLQATALEQPQDYFVTLLQMALEESKQPGEHFEYRFSDRDYSQARWINQLENDSGNLVIWTMTNRQREASLLPIRVPLFKGLFGHRVFIIRKKDQPLFDQVRTKDHLAKLVAGQGLHWPDVDILQANTLPVTTGATMDSLFKMLKAGRFDYFPRGVAEAWFELDQRRDPALAVEEKLMLVYPTAIYYFVNKNNPQLAHRIEAGLEALIDDGRFDAFFQDHKRTQEGLAQVTSKPRRPIYLENPDLPEQLPQPAERYWISLPLRTD